MDWRALRRVFFELFRQRPGIQTFRIFVAFDQFDHRHRRIVAITESGLNYTRVTATAVGISICQRIEQSLLCIVAQHRKGPAAVVETPALTQGDHLSTIGRRSFAFGKVVLICSCLIKAAAMFENIALRCSLCGLVSVRSYDVA